MKMRALSIIGFFSIVAVVWYVVYGPREISTYESAPGWMDDEPLTDQDRARIAKVTGQSFEGNLGVIRSIQSGAHSGLSRRDFELLRQDRRRAQAAYPEVRRDDLLANGWFQVDLSARVPHGWCSSGNSNGTQGDDGKWYLDGGCYLSFVRSEYPNRADAQTTKRVLQELKDADRQKSIKHISKWGYSTSWGGTSGSGSMNCYPDPLPSDREESDLVIPGKCVVIFGDTKYTFPFVTSEWVDPPWTLDKVKSLASFSVAITEHYIPVPPKPRPIKDGLLAHGETGKPGRIYHSLWNGDGYDNSDIGPSNPASWVLERPFGIAYLPAPDNGDARSIPGKPWYLVISYYGAAPIVSGGWTEEEAKALLPKFTTDTVFPLNGQDYAEANRGNLKEARCTQSPNMDGVLLLKDRALPVAPTKAPPKIGTIYQ
jgi:hypothetical protein